MLLTETIKKASFTNDLQAYHFPFLLTFFSYLLHFLTLSLISVAEGNPQTGCGKEKAIGCVNSAIWRWVWALRVST